MNSLAGIDMGRILLNLSNELFKQLDDLEVQRNLPRAELLREAVDQYLVNQSQTARASAFGIWQGSEEDGVEYQREAARGMVMAKRFGYLISISLSIFSV